MTDRLAFARHVIQGDNLDLGLVSYIVDGVADRIGVCRVDQQ